MRLAFFIQGAAVYHWDSDALHFRLWVSVSQKLCQFTSPLGILAVLQQGVFCVGEPGVDLAG